VLVLEVATVRVGGTVVMVAEDPPEGNPDVGGGARIAAIIAGMSSVVKGRGEGSEV